MDATMPSDVSDDVGIFDRFARVTTSLVSRAPFFVACVALVVLWLPSYWLFADTDTWQLLINTATTVVTFLLVALIQNSQFRDDQALQHKLNAIAEALADLVGRDEGLEEDVHELRRAVGLEHRESSG
jgi:low affinity Fe/Cu permease